MKQQKKEIKQTFYGCGQGFWANLTALPWTRGPLSDQPNTTLSKIDFLEYYSIRDDPIIQIEISSTYAYDFCFFLTHSGRVYSLGSRNDSGWLGVGDCDSRQIPTAVLQFEGLDLSVDQIVQIRVGEKHALFLSKLGRVFSCGSNEFGQLGSLLRKECSQPVEILQTVFDSPIRKIFTGPFQSYFVSEKYVYACGNNKIEQLFMSEWDDFKSKYVITTPTDISHYLKYLTQRNISVDEVEIVGGHTRSVLLEKGKKVAVSDSDVMVEYQNDRPQHEQCYVGIPSQMLSDNVKKMILSKHNIVSLLDSGECLVSGQGNFLGLSTREQVLTFEKIPLQDEYIDDVWSGPYHVILKTSSRKLYSFGSNRFGELGKNTNSKSISFRELKPIELPFEWKEGEDVKVFCGSNYTLIVHETCLPTTQELIATNVVMSSDESGEPSQYFHVENSEINVFLPLVKKISQDLFSLITNKEITDRLVEEELVLLRKICKFICCELSLTIEEEFGEDSSYTDNLFINFDRFLSGISEETIEKDIITCLFFLNDISDVGLYFKTFLFNELSNRITVDNVMDLLLRTSNYLSWKLLKKSEHSIMVLFVKKCFAFIKKNADQCNLLYGSLDEYIKIKPKVEHTKSSFFAIQVQWKENSISANLEKLLNSLLEDYSLSDLEIIIGPNKEDTMKIHKCILSANSPVLSVMLSQTHEAIIDLFEFSLMMSTSLNEMFFENCEKSRSEILKMVVEMCYGKFRDNYSLNELICILFISHQFQMGFIVKDCCNQLIGNMFSNKCDINLLFYLATVLEVDALCKDFMETFIIYCSSLLTPDNLQELIKMYSDEQFTPQFISRVRTLQDLIFKKHMDK